ncbi:MAG: hypothetical protein WBE76_08220 [Terracidiphilus sp.]
MKNSNPCSGHMGALHQSIGVLINLRGCYRAPIRPHNSSLAGESRSHFNRDEKRCKLRYSAHLGSCSLLQKKRASDGQFQSFDFELRYADDDTQIELIGFLSKPLNRQRAAELLEECIALLSPVDQRAQRVSRKFLPIEVRVV